MNFSASLRGSDASLRLLKQAGRWWLNELSGMVPAWIRAMFTPKTRRMPLLEIGPAGATLIVPGKGPLKSTRLPILGEPSEGARLEVQAALRVRMADRAITIRLAHALVFETSLVLPLAAERSLPQILYHQLERLVPLDISSVRYVFQVIARSDETKSMRIRVVIGRNDTIEQAINLAQRLALHPDTIVVGSDRDSISAHWIPVLWRAADAKVGGSQRRVWMRGLEVATAAALVVAAGLYTHRLDREAILLKEDVAKLKYSVAKTVPIATQVNQLKAELVALEERRSAPSPLVVLAELTRRIPADGWVFQFSMRGHVVELSGFSSRATDLIGDVAASPLFVNPKFRSPITLSPDGKGDRFDLTFETKRAASR